MELIINARLESFITWLRAEINDFPQMSSILKINGRDLMVVPCYSPFEAEDEDGLHFPHISFDGVTLPGYENMIEQSNQNKQGQDLEEDEDEQLGSIEMRDLGENRIIVKIYSNELDFDIILKPIIGKIYKIWSVNTIEDSLRRNGSILQQEITPLSSWEEKMLEMWNSNMSVKEISIELQKSGIKKDVKTITNRLSILRKNLGEEVVPLNKNRNKRGYFH